MRPQDDYALHGFDTSKLPDGNKKIAWAIMVHQVKDHNGWAIRHIDTMTLTKSRYLNIASRSVCKVWRIMNSTQGITMRPTQYGYLPTEITSVKPDKTERCIYEVYFGNEGWEYMYHSAKWKAQWAKEKMLKARCKKPTDKMDQTEDAMGEC